MTVQDRIQTTLRDIETNNNVKILYACESGSRAWGFPSRDSDYDVRFIYLRPPEWYLSVDSERRRDVLEYPIDAVLDISGWDLKKALNLMKKSNPPLFEWLYSPIVYRQDVAFFSRIKTLSATYYQPRACFYHYSHMAKRNYREYLKAEQVRIKKYFYVLRPLLALQWLERDWGIVPMEFMTLVERLLPAGELQNDIVELVERKRQGFEKAYDAAIPSINAFLEQEFARLEHLIDNSHLPYRDTDYEAMNGLFLWSLQTFMGLDSPTAQG